LTLTLLQQEKSCIDPGQSQDEIKLDKNEEKRSTERARGMVDRPALLDDMSGFALAVKEPF
jgi:hypothetical protein